MNTVRLQEMKSRATRVASGDPRVEDFAALLLFLRDRAGDKQTIREIGDFVAHSDQRKKGYITNHFSDFFVILRYHYLAEGEGRLTYRPRTEKVHEALLRNFHKLPDKEIIKATRMKRKLALIHLKSALAKFEPAGPDGLKQIAAFTPPESASVSCALCVNAKPLFTGKSLFEDLMRCLISNDFIDRRNVRPNKSTSERLSIYLSTLMHGAEIVAADDVSTFLRAGADNNGYLTVFAETVIQKRDGADIQLVTTMFETGIVLNQHSDIPHHVEDPWTFPIEINDQFQIVRMM